MLASSLDLTMGGTAFPKVLCREKGLTTMPAFTNGRTSYIDLSRNKIDKLGKNDFILFRLGPGPAAWQAILKYESKCSKIF